MYGLSCEASAIRKDSNNECRRVSRGRSSRPRAGQSEGPNRVLSHATICVIGNFSSQMSEEEISFQDDRAYPDNREEVTISSMQSLKWITSTKSPYAERYVRWCGRKENESRPDNLLRFLTYPIFLLSLSNFTFFTLNETSICNFHIFKA